MKRTTLGRFEILAAADLQVAILNIQSSLKLHTSFNARDVAMIATVVSELGSNILKYGGSRGYVLATWTEDPGQADGGVEIRAVDYGPGFIDPDSALKDHYSTGGTLGLGLPGVARIMDSLEIESHPGRGATVTARKRATRRGT